MTQQNSPKTTTNTGSDDPIKNFIALRTVKTVLGLDDPVDPNQDISANTQENADTLAVGVNNFALQGAQNYNYTWNVVKPSDIRTIKTIGDLVNLIISHLAAPGAQ